MQYTYSLSLLRYAPGAKFPEPVTSIRITGLDSDREFVEDLNELVAHHQTNLTNAKPVVATAVDAAMFKLYDETAENRHNIPANGKFARPVTAGQLFSSATTLSKHLGASVNECSARLSTARRSSPPSTYATVRGVTFCLVADLPPSV